MLTDPRHRLMVPDNYTVQRLGFVSCGTASYRDLSGRASISGDYAAATAAHSDGAGAGDGHDSSGGGHTASSCSSTSALAALSKHFSVVCLPTFTTTEIHVALISGASVALAHGIEQAHSTSNMPQVRPFLLIASIRCCFYNLYIPDYLTSLPPFPFPIPHSPFRIPHSGVDFTPISLPPLGSQTRNSRVVSYYTIHIEQDDSRYRREFND